MRTRPLVLSALFLTAVLTAARSQTAPLPAKDGPAESAPALGDKPAAPPASDTTIKDSEPAHAAVAAKSKDSSGKDTLSVDFPDTDIREILRNVADLFELNGWRGYFLGANTPVRDLLQLIQEKQPEVVALSVTVFFGMDALLHAAGAIRAQFPSVPILVGGQAFRWGGRERAEQIPGVEYLPSLAELELWIQSHSSHAP